MTVKRYDVVFRIDDEGEGYRKVRDVNGEYVLYADYATLHASWVRLSEALKNVVVGNQIAFERNQSMTSWPSSAFKKQADAALQDASRIEEP